MKEIRPRPATYEKVEYQGRPLDLSEDFREVLKRGHIIDVHTTGGGVRVVRVVESLDPRGPLLGYGQDVNIEDALRRARDTYWRRETEGEPRVSLGVQLNHWPEAGMGIYVGDHQIGSPLDGVAFIQGFRAYQEGQEIVAQTKYGGFAVEPLVGRGSTLEEAVDAMCGRL